MKKIIYSPGEPAGIGPDLIIKLSASNIWENFKIPIVTIGDPNLFLDRAKKLKKKIKVIELNSVNEVKKNKKAYLQIIKVSKCKNTSPGKLTKLNANYVLDVLDYAIKQTISDKCAALVTGPLNKETIISIDQKFTGHTEYIQKITRSKDVLMMLASNKLKVALATTHIPLKMVSKNITKKLIVNKVQILNKDLKNKFNIKKPNIKVLGLNPHAGENGKIGNEELQYIKPAIKILRKSKINVSMPISADTAFSEKILKETDAYLGMYHDQVLIPFKMKNKFDGLNITIGKKIIRLSPDHGTGKELIKKPKFINNQSFLSCVKFCEKY